MLYTEISSHSLSAILVKRQQAFFEKLATINLQFPSVH